MQYKVVPVLSSYSIGGSHWASDVEKILNNHASLGWRLKEAVWHEQNLSCLILESDGPPGEPETLQLARIEKKVDLLVEDTKTVNRRKFKFDEQNG